MKLRRESSGGCICSSKARALTIGSRVHARHSRRRAPLACFNARWPILPGEGVGAWHQCHSFVRGHWAVTGKATPMLVAKSCHDMDLVSWLVGRPCLRVSSFGSLSHFNASNAPAGAPARCTDGCPVDDTCCPNTSLLCDLCAFARDTHLKQSPSGH